MGGLFFWLFGWFPGAMAMNQKERWAWRTDNKNGTTQGAITYSTSGKGKSSSKVPFKRGYVGSLEGRLHGRFHGGLQEFLEKPMKSRTCENSQGLKIVRVSAGDQHMGALTKEGKAGRKKTFFSYEKTVMTIARMNVIAGTGKYSIWMHLNHSFDLPKIHSNKKNHHDTWQQRICVPFAQLYTWGYNDFGQLGGCLSHGQVSWWMAWGFPNCHGLRLGLAWWRKSWTTETEPGVGWKKNWS